MIQFQGGKNLKDVSKSGSWLVVTELKEAENCMSMTVPLGKESDEISYFTAERARVQEFCLRLALREPRSAPTKACMIRIAYLSVKYGVHLAWGSRRQNKPMFFFGNCLFKPDIE